MTAPITCAPPATGSYWWLLLVVFGWALLMVACWGIGKGKF